MKHHKYLTLFIVGLERASIKRIVVPANFIKYFYHYLACAVIFLFSIFTISLVIFSNYHNVKSENTVLLGKIESIQKETEIIETNKLSEKLNLIDRNLTGINHYILESEVQENADKSSRYTPYGDYNVEIINYYYDYT